ncbi:hypothetical protein WDW86_21040 [Bdellovibrionota bacterium FG-2]
MPSLVLLLILSQNLGVGHRFPWSWLPWGMGRGFWLVATVFFIAACFSKSLRQWHDQKAEGVLSGRAERGFYLGLVFLNAGNALLNFGYFRGLGYSFPVLHLIVCLVAGVLTWRGVNPLRVALGFGLGLLAASIIHFPLNSVRSDMLPVIAGAFERWRQGFSPYGGFDLNGSSNTMPYLPGVFLSHWPAWMSGIDLRWGSALFRLVWGVLLIAHAERLPFASLWKKVAATWLLNPYLGFRHDLYFEFFNLLIVAFWCVRSVRGVVLALMIVSRQWAWIWAPFLVFSWGGNRNSWRDLGVFVFSLAGLVGFGVLLFGGSTTGTQFLGAILGGFQERLTWNEFPGDFGLTLAPLFYALHMAPWLQWVQAAICGGLLGWVVFFRRDQALYYGWVTLALFLMFNMHFWNYFWLSPSLFLMMGGIKGEVSDESVPGRSC